MHVRFSGAMRHPSRPAGTSSPASTAGARSWVTIRASSSSTWASASTSRRSTRASSRCQPSPSRLVISTRGPGSNGAGSNGYAERICLSPVLMQRSQADEPGPSPACQRTPEAYLLDFRPQLRGSLDAQASVAGAGDGLGAAGEAELGEDATHVVSRGLGGDEQTTANFGVGQSASD